MFPGTSTMNQLDRIIEVIGFPSKQEIDAINSPFAKTMLESVIPPSKNNKKSIREIFSKIEPEAIDLLNRLLVFDPKKRLSAIEALAHPYLAQFHNCEDEPESTQPIRISIDDNKKFSVSQYRDELYRYILKKKKKENNGSTERKKTKNHKSSKNSHRHQKSRGSHRHHHKDRYHRKKTLQQQQEENDEHHQNHDENTFPHSHSTSHLPSKKYNMYGHGNKHHNAHKQHKKKRKHRQQKNMYNSNSTSNVYEPSTSKYYSQY